MNKSSTTKVFLQAAVILAITVAFIMPVTAVAPKNIVMKNQIVSPYDGPSSRADSWVMQASGFSTPSRGINYISIVDENIVWAAGYDGLSPTAPCQDFTRTLDGGALWTEGFINGASGLSLAMIFAVDANTAWAPMYAATSGTQGIYKTIDGGLTWNRQTTADFNGAGAFPDCVHFWDANNGWCVGDPVGGYYEIYTTTDGGTTWVRVPSENIPAPLSGEFAIVGYYDVVGDTIWFGTQYGRVYKSIDRGLHWTVAQTTLSAYIKPSFKDQNNGVVIDLNAEAIAYLSETNDGGTTWTTIEYVGNCYDSDLIYVPGTDNMYISTGAAQTGSGASYSLDGCHTWTEYDAQVGLQMMNMDFIEGKIGWAGAFSTDETHDGVWKYVPGPDAPAFTITIEGGKGITATITNVGAIDATDLETLITIEGGFWIKTREYPSTETGLPVGDSLVIEAPVMGIGLGIFTQMPKIKVTVNCAENVTAEKSVEAKIILTKVNLM